MMYIALPKAAGIVSTSVADALVKASSRFDQFGYNIAENLGGQLAKAVGGSIADVFKEGDMKKVKDGFFAMAQAVDRSRKCVSGPWGSADCK